jgi:arylsulfatase A-like enzyme
LGCYGDANADTPRLDQMAAKGIRFTRAYTAAPQCMPSRTAIFTGRHPVEVNMSRFSAPLPRDVPTFLKLLRDHGYFTGLVRRWHHLDGMVRKPDWERRIMQRHDLQTAKDRVDFLKYGGDRRKTSKQVRTFLDKRQKDQPFFLYVGFNDPHRPWNAGDRFRPEPDKLKLPPQFPDRAAVRKDLANYYGEVNRLDREFATVTNILKERDLLNNTLLVFMGDNGAAVLRGKGTLYEAGCRVPLLMQWPGVISPGTVSDELISGVDLAPTFLEAAGVPVPKQMTGRSFLPLLEGERYKGRTYVYTERGAHGNALPKNTEAFDLVRAITGERYKLIYRATWQLPYTPVDMSDTSAWQSLKDLHKQGALANRYDRLYFSESRPMFELYDLKADPHELNNLAGSEKHKDVRWKLRKKLSEKMILWKDFLPLPARRRD